MPLLDEDLSKMDENELLVLVIEEAAEVIQAACKCRRFGLGESWKEGDDSNIQALCSEAEQMDATTRVLGAKLGINYGRTCYLRNIAAKKQKEQK